MCLFRVPSIMVQPGCHVCVCEGEIPLCVSVYSTVENKRLQERKGQEGPSHTSLHVKLEERGVELFTSRSLFKQPPVCQCYSQTHTHTHVYQKIYADSFAKCLSGG